MVNTSPRPPIGQPVLDPFHKQVILRVIGRGYSRPMAARFAGCAVSTIMRTAQRDPQFAADLAQAETLFLGGSLQTLHQAACQDKNWRAAAWVAERLEPQRFARRPPHTLTSPEEVGGALIDFLTRISEQLPEEYRDVPREVAMKFINGMVEEGREINIEELFASWGVLPDEPDARPAAPLEPTSIRAARQAAAARAAEAAAAPAAPAPAPVPAPAREAASETPESQAAAEASGTSAAEPGGVPDFPRQNPGSPGVNTGQSRVTGKPGQGPVQRVAPD
jgi:ribosomal protein L12E/L44/L45/RPP1/RPP2